MDTLFEMPPPDKHAGTGHVCRECAYCVRPHFYRHDWCYCEQRPSGRTQFGIAKIKAMDKACRMFKEQEKE